MTKPRCILGLQLLLAAVGLAAVGLGWAAAAGQLSLTPPSTATLLDACQRLLLPDASPAGVVGLLLGTLAFAVLGRTLWSVVRQLRASRRMLRALRVVEKRSVGGQGVTVIGGARPVAFCAGVLRPRIYISTGTMATLDRLELGAVVAHERHHARLHDPLRLLLSRALADGLFFLPALRSLGERYEELAELAADRAAVRASRDDAAPLASALLSFEGADPAVVGIAPERVDHLMGERSPWQLPTALLQDCATSNGRFSSTVAPVAWRSSATTTNAETATSAHATDQRVQTRAVPAPSRPPTSPPPGRRKSDGRPSRPSVALLALPHPASRRATARCRSGR